MSETKKKPLSGQQVAWNKERERVFAKMGVAVPKGSSVKRLGIDDARTTVRKSGGAVETARGGQVVVRQGGPVAGHDEGDGWSPQAQHASEAGIGYKQPQGPLTKAQAKFGSEHKQAHHGEIMRRRVAIARHPENDAIASAPYTAADTRTLAEVNDANRAAWGGRPQGPAARDAAKKETPHKGEARVARMGVPGFHHGETVKIEEHVRQKGESRYRATSASGSSGWFYHGDLEK
jgi:hypothetical protein